MMRTEDLTGRTFGRWLVLYQVEDFILPNKQHQPAWMCECACEKHTKKIVNGYSLKRGDSMSCGCYYDEVVGKCNKKYNVYTLIDNEYYIGRTQSGKEFYFDKDDYEEVSKYCWDIDSSHGYVKTLVKGKKLYLHRLIMSVDSNKNTNIDHRNRQRNDCRKCNLKVVSNCQNSMNVGVRSDNSSGIKGVCLNKQSGKFCVRISANKQKYNLGTFTDFTDAVLARLTAEEEMFEEFMTKDNRTILAYIRNGGQLEYGNKDLIKQITNRNN